jgi:hypothetical protein
MAFDILTIDDNRWPELIKQSDADIFYEPSYCRFLTEGTQHRPVMFLYQDDLGQVFDVTLIKAISSLPFFATIADSLPHLPVDLASPDYNSPIVLANPGDFDEILRRYRHAIDAYCIETGVVTEFIRFHPLSESAARSAGTMEIHPGSELLYIDLTPGYEVVVQKYRRDHRSTIKRAAQNGASFRFCSSEDMDGLTRIHQLWTETMQRNNAKSVYLYSPEHFRKMACYLGDRLLMMESLVGNNVASIDIFLLGRKHMWFKYSGLDQRFRGSGAHTFMMDRAIHWACDQGFDHFMLGGGAKPGDSIHAYKRGFSHRSASVHHMKKVHDPKALALLLEAKKAYDSRLGLSTETDYFPSYWLG